MKKMIPILFVLILSACGDRPLTASLSSASPGGKTVISVSGKRQTGLDPFSVTMEVKTGSVVSGSLQFEVAASMLDAGNVKFDWKDDENCLITFTYSDGEKRVFRYYATESNVILEQVGTVNP